ncbi:hypothetical protein SAICODRAFT_8773 [Saitoella complicata NRRL Y-17804]|uniref:SMP domain-containing protein n=1 Tax=Saitoella complicata (strain BCRC 22490 / CBS 7301 / JCM 7358 / NBRC 10748 / NRRL Y-17804) TaxID=698492 RepID=A0A0E9NBK4_SAICN|nr:uncharacterized protein SAICODRAFT_8773 [Saitoella complicata NRRL Y-17804]ODQ51472.1 hypothetical protein SAICODRAFT_8773 [Saitoella complicata NRRL Y-17804]GAO47219.1 hypothetical protein G7K_1429-t1 [Saitoella complicata NRRL Y-17804]
MSGKMSQSDASRIQSSQAKSGNNPGFAARAQSAGDRNANSGQCGGGGGGGGGQSGGGGQQGGKAGSGDGGGQRK